MSFSRLPRGMLPRYLHALQAGPFELLWRWG